MKYAHAVPEKHRPALVRIGDILCPGDDSLAEDVRAAMAAPDAYFMRWAEQSHVRRAGLSTISAPWRALLEGLKKRSLLVEIDRHERARDAAVELAHFGHTPSIDDRMELTAMLDTWGTELRAHGRVLASFTAAEDTYALVHVPQEQLAPMRRAVRDAGADLEVWGKRARRRARPASPLRRRAEDFAARAEAARIHAERDSPGIPLAHAWRFALGSGRARLASGDPVTACMETWHHAVTLRIRALAAHRFRMAHDPFELLDLELFGAAALLGRARELAAAFDHIDFVGQQQATDLHRLVVAVFGGNQAPKQDETVGPLTPIRRLLRSVGASRGEFQKRLEDYLRMTWSRQTKFHKETGPLSLFALGVCALQGQLPQVESELARFIPCDVFALALQAGFPAAGGYVASSHQTLGELALPAWNEAEAIDPLVIADVNQRVVEATHRWLRRSIHAWSTSHEAVSLDGCFETCIDLARLAYAAGQTDHVGESYGVAAATFAHVSFASTSFERHPLWRAGEARFAFVDAIEAVSAMYLAGKLQSFAQSLAEVRANKPLDDATTAVASSLVALFSDAAPTARVEGPVGAVIEAARARDAIRTREALATYLRDVWMPSLAPERQRVRAWRVRRPTNPDPLEMDPYFGSVSLFARAIARLVGSEATPARCGCPAIARGDGVIRPPEEKPPCPCSRRWCHFSVPI